VPGETELRLPLDQRRLDVDRFQRRIAPDMGPQRHAHQRAVAESGFERGEELIGLGQLRVDGRHSEAETPI